MVFVLYDSQWHPFLLSLSSLFNKNKMLSSSPRRLWLIFHTSHPLPCMFVSVCVSVCILQGSAMSFSEAENKDRSSSFREIQLWTIGRHVETERREPCRKEGRSEGETSGDTEEKVCVRLCVCAGLFLFVGQMWRSASWQLIGRRIYEERKWNLNNLFPEYLVNKENLFFFHY